MIRGRIKTYLKAEVGWVEVVLICCFIILIIWAQLQKYELNSNAAFSKGVIIGKHKGANGSVYWDFNFYAGEQLIESFMPYDKKYRIGDSIKIKYQVDNPHHNIVYNN